MTSTIGSRTRKFAPRLNLWQEECQRSLILTSIIAGTWSSKRDLITTTWERSSRISCTREDMITTTSTIGSSRSQDNRSIPKIMLMPNQLLQAFRARWRIPQKWQLEILASRNSSKRGRKTEPILDSKWSMGLPPLDKIQRPRERLHWTQLPKHPHNMAGILKLQDGPTASFQLPCNSRQIPHPMEHTAEALHRDKSPRATGEQMLVKPLASHQVETSQFPNRKLRL